MPRPGYDAVVLLTGFPSFYAKKMLEEVLVREPKSLVHAVVMQRLLPRAIADLEGLPPDQRERVVLVEGDAAAMDLGLSGAEFRQLTREVDRIHHVAHVSYLGVDKATAKQLNVGGTAEILEFARACSSLETLVFHSTANVSGDRTGTVYEDDLDAGQSYRTIIEETRARAEMLARRAMRDLPVAVVRPTTIVGDSGTGEIDRLDGLYLLVMLFVAMPADMAIPFPGKGEAPLNIVPIDFVVRAAHAIGMHPAARGKTFHLADPNALSARSVFDLVARASGRRALRSHIPSNIAKALLRTPGIERYMRSPREFVEQLTSAVRYDTRNADMLLAGTGISCPPFDSYVDQLVKAAQEHIELRQKRGKELGAEVEVDDPLS